MFTSGTLSWRYIRACWPLDRGGLPSMTIFIELIPTFQTFSYIHPSVGRSVHFKFQILLLSVLLFTLYLFYVWIHFVSFVIVTWDGFSRSSFYLVYTVSFLCVHQSCSVGLSSCRKRERCFPDFCPCVWSLEWGIVVRGWSVDLSKREYIQQIISVTGAAAVDVNRGLFEVFFLVGGGLDWIELSPEKGHLFYVSIYVCTL